MQDHLDRKELYRTTLTRNIIPFWLEHGWDRQGGGFWTALDRTGTLIDSDKSVWFQGRFSWVLSTVHTDVEANQEWLDAARSGIEFLEQHGFDDDGRMFFRLTSDGEPVVKRLRYVASEVFMILALAAWSRATGEGDRLERAREILIQVQRARREPGILTPKFNPRTRASVGLSVPMILMNAVQELRRADPGRKAEYDLMIDGLINEIRGFLNEEHEAVLEQTNPDGGLQDHFEGRLLNPGHAMEAAWFILVEARERDQDPELTALGCKILDWMWKWGWDDEYGGIIYYRDILGKPAAEYWHDMKFWWPQNETAIATLMGYAATGEEKYLTWHALLMDWIEKLFPDPEYGGWFGYFHRDGRRSTDLKGNLYKGPFHVPRMYYRLWCILKEMNR